MFQPTWESTSHKAGGSAAEYASDSTDVDANSVSIRMEADPLTKLTKQIRQDRQKDNQRNLRKRVAGTAKRIAESTTRCEEIKAAYDNPESTFQYRGKGWGTFISDIQRQLSAAKHISDIKAEPSTLLSVDADGASNTQSFTVLGHTIGPSVDDPFPPLRHEEGSSGSAAEWKEAFPEESNARMAFDEAVKMKVKDANERLEYISRDIEQWEGWRNGWYNWIDKFQSALTEAEQTNGSVRIDLTLGRLSEEDTPAIGYSALPYFPSELAISVVEPAPRTWMDTVCS